MQRTAPEITYNASMQKVRHGINEWACHSEIVKIERCYGSHVENVDISTLEKRLFLDTSDVIFTKS